ncbi:AbrB/MazE/SpoVT family DNA-binding domain-containing protein [Thermovenabulum gondwanense]|uniref:Antitoxin MazE n=1 Tax=Thermovenabulum gondwanense TaxID=520767 RepID=A0A162MU42_9FIRM|nr:AbrB/MazE/SpoVT family DNA-binding domain-containing protein [Thermovenabulum gondwanense]KYO67342.1 Antitoxin MazE [Thermovenabulum gondwanense]
MESNEQKEVPLMTAKVQKWGNSLAIRIPSVIAEQLAIRQGLELEMVIENQAIKLIPKKKKPTLEELLAKITPENRHAEIDFGVEGNELF